MASPVIQSVQYDGTDLYLFWDRAVVVDPLVGDDITLVHDGAPLTAAFATTEQNRLTLTISGPVTGELLVSYDDANAYVEDTGGDPAVSFTEQLATELYVVDTAVSALAGEPANNQISVVFSAPVVAQEGDPSHGFLIEVNGAVVPGAQVTGEITDGQSTVVLTLPFNLSYTDIVELSYTSVPGTGLYTFPGGDVDDFLFAEVPNLATDGLPDSPYPLSTAVRWPVSMVASEARGQIDLYLNPIDRELVSQFGPAVVVTGGTFGPEDRPFSGTSAHLKDGLTLTCSFTNGSTTAVNVASAKDWLEQVTERVGRELGRLRAESQSVVLGDREITGV